MVGWWCYAILFWCYWPLCWFSLVHLLLCAWLLLLALIDWHTWLLPHRYTHSLLFIGLMWAVYGDGIAWQDSVLGMIMGFVSLWLINAVYRIVRSADGMGGGDFYLSAALGAWFGWYTLPTLWMLSSLSGLLWALVWGLKQRQLPYGVPFGPYLALSGSVLVWFEPQMMTLWSA